MKITRELLSKYSEGLCTPEEITIVEQWLASDEVSGITDDLAVPEEIKYSIWNKFHTQAGLAPLRRTGRLSYLQPLLRIAVIVLLIAGGTAVVYRLLQRPGSRSELVSIAAAQQRKKILLSDSSVVFLSPGSSIRLLQPFDGNKREIILTGEASFEVAKDAHRPFSVVSGSVRTTALGTSFKVAGDDSKVFIALSSGKIVVSHQPKDASVDSLYLTPGESAEYTVSDHLLQKMVAEGHPYNFRKDILYFRNADVPEVMEKLAGLYHLRIRYDALKDRHWQVSGEFDGQPLDIVLKNIAYTCNIRYAQLKDSLILEPLKE